MKNLGINATTIKSGVNKDLGSQTTPMSEEQKEILQGISNEVFMDFKSVILENRKEKLDMASFEEVLDARIMLGTQAKKIGLIDGLGTKKDAINKAAELAGIEGEPRICKISIGEQKTSLFDVAGFFRGFFYSSNSYGLKYLAG
jgi:protease-4